MNQSFLLNGSKLYKIVNIYENIISVIPESKSMTKKLAGKTYLSSQFEHTGYIIEGAAK